MGLFDYPIVDPGAIAQLKKRMELMSGGSPPEGVDTPAPPVRVGQTPMVAPPAAPMALPQNARPLPVVDTPPMMYQKAVASQGPGGLFKRPDAPAEYGASGFFTKDELAQATPGHIQSLLGRLIGESPQNIMRMNLDDVAARKAQIGAYQDKETARKEAATEKAGLESVRSSMPPMPDPSNYAATLSWNRAYVAKLMGKGLIKQAYQMAQYLPMEPPKDVTPRSLTWRDNVRFDGDPNTYQAAYDQNGNLVRKDLQSVKPDAGGTLTEYQKQSLALQRERMNKVPTASNRPLTESERKNGALLMTAEQANNNLRSLGNKFAPTFTEKMKSRVGLDVGNMMNAEEFQQFNQAALQMSDAWLRFTSGAAVPETEVARFAATFTPRPGDKSKTLLQKSRAREMIVRAMRQGAGRAVSDAEAAIRDLQGGDANAMFDEVSP